MKTILSITSGLILITLFTFGCKKDSSNQELLTSQLQSTEKHLQQSYQIAKTNDDLLKVQVTAGGHFTDINAMMEDSLYHRNDSLCNAYYLTYCKDIMDGDNMMGGSMIGGNTMHGSGMMATHTFIGDTAIVNQCFRNLNTIHQAHSTHHPIK